MLGHYQILTGSDHSCKAWIGRGRNTMPSGHPSDMVPMDWYTAARTIDQNRATNEAFRSSYQTPSVAPTPSRPATFNTIRFQAPEWSTNHQHAPTPGNPVPMDIDASQKMQPLPFSCYRCGKAGHKAPDCPTWFNIWELSIDDLQTYLEDHLAELYAKHPEPAAEVEEQDFPVAMSEQHALVVISQLFLCFTYMFP